MVNSNNKLILILPLVIILGAVVGLMAVNKSSSMPKESTTNEEVVETDTTKETTEAMKEKTEETKSPTLEDFTSLITGEVPENALKYVLTSKSSASYVATKTYFGKPAISVVGTTEGVVGAAWYDEESKNYYLKADIDLTKLKSDSEKRDGDILPLFVPPKAMLELNGDNADGKLSLTEPFETQIAGNLTVGETTQEVVFDVTGSITKNSFAAEGVSKVKMSDFNIKAPSLFEVFSVADDMELKFTVDAVAVK